MRDDRILELIVRILEECLEHEYTAEELRSRIVDMLSLLNSGSCRPNFSVRQVEAEYKRLKGELT